MNINRNDWRQDIGELNDAVANLKAAHNRCVQVMDRAYDKAFDMRLIVNDDNGFFKHWLEAKQSLHSIKQPIELTKIFVQLLENGHDQR